MKSLFFSYWNVSKIPIDVDIVTKPNFMPDNFSIKVWTGKQQSSAPPRQPLARDASWEGLVREPHCCSCLSDEKINICLTVADHWEIEWISSWSQISSSCSKGWIPKQMCLGGSRPSGWRVQAGLGAGVRVKFRGWRSDEGQGYGQVRVMVRSKYLVPSGQHLSGNCLPLCPVREISSNILQLWGICKDYAAMK